MVLLKSFIVIIAYKVGRNILVSVKEYK